MRQKKMKLAKVLDGSTVDPEKLLYPRDRFELISIDRVDVYEYPYERLYDGKVHIYINKQAQTIVTLKCKRCGSVRQIIDRSSASCKEGPCNKLWQDLSNKTFGDLTAMEYVWYRPKKDIKAGWYWRCVCKCGKECYKTTHALLHVGRRQCPSCAKKLAGRKMLKGEDSLWYREYERTRAAAYKRGYSFSLTLEQYKELCNKACYYCGDLPAKTKWTGLLKNGIDRFDNTKGYEDGNCVPCCSTCNQMKMAFDYSYWISHIEKILEHCKERSTTISKESTLKRVETDSPEKEDIV